MAKSNEAARIVLWMCWIVQWLISSIYVALSLITLSKLAQASSEVFVDSTDLVKNKIWRAPMAACLLSALLVIGFDVLSCVTLIKKSINRAGPGFGYGFLVAFCFALSFFLFLCGLVLDGFKQTVKDVLEKANVTAWTSASSDLYLGTLVFALIGFCTFFLFGIILVILQSSMLAQLGIETKPKYNPLYGPPADGYPGNDFAEQQQDTDNPFSHNQAYSNPEYNSQAAYQSGRPGPSSTGAGEYQGVASEYQESTYTSYQPSPTVPAYEPKPQQQEYNYMGPQGGLTGYGYASLASTPVTPPPEAHPAPGGHAHPAPGGPQANVQMGGRI